ncbi:MAG: response regulator transcription factor [Tessaracoccus sp.]|uniref:winged helix-turn-helix domain-containing protein n=1 Tax=Tessaracoccus sp. TaxID=1971211 RepID=UPI001ED30149|nr:response regulator transcription factor [Tessaracoccus sp.]MBK7822650.1 response regulator transcription factor [Tessaracoccus sp.]
MSAVLFVSGGEPPDELRLLSHQLRGAASASDALLAAEAVDVIIVDARTDLASARATCQTLAKTVGTPVLLLAPLTALAVLAPDWGFTDFVAAGSEPAELDARLRILTRASADPDVFTAGPLRVDGAAYTATLDGEPLDLTYTEFELLRYLMQHPGRVLSRETLVSQVWGYDYYGGTRTVDVHVRRLRAKLGQYDHYIGTVRNVGYRFASTREGTRAG